MDVKLYANQSLLDMTKLKDSTFKAKEPQTNEEREKFVEDLIDFSKEAKESRKQQLLNSIFPTNQSGGSETDSLSKYIDKLKDQHKTLKSQMSRTNYGDKKNIQGQISLVESQLQTLELKQIEIKRAEVGLS